MTLNFWIIIASILAGAVVLYFVVFGILQLFARKNKFVSEKTLKRCKIPTLLLFLAIVFRIALPLFNLPDKIVPLVTQLFSIATIIAISWLLIRMTGLLEDYLFEKYRIDVQDNLQARKVHTQLNVMKRIIVVVIMIIAIATILMTFERVRQFGTTILASAGIIGIVVGMAAQRTIGTFIAGLQIAVTQPIRLDDVVIVENEWGRIEEITLTYVVIRIWDQRRLIVPITYFIEKPFQNWTRVNADILGTVYLYVDYSVPVEKIREYLKQILNESDLWDKKVCVLQVTNTSEKTVEIRALMSASDASKAWSLRCHVREKLVQFVQEQFPGALPKVRAEMTPLK